MTKPTKWVCAQQRQISLGICPVWSESSLSAWWKLGTLAAHWAHTEDSDQTGWMVKCHHAFPQRSKYLQLHFLQSFSYIPMTSIPIPNYVAFLLKTLNVPYRNKHLQFYHCWLSRVLDIQNHTFFHRFWMEKSVDLLVSDFFLYCDLSGGLFPWMGKGFRFPPV